MAGVTIQWRDSLDSARREAHEQGKLILIDFFNPG